MTTGVNEPGKSHLQVVIDPVVLGVNLMVKGAVPEVVLGVKSAVKAVVAEIVALASFE
ncbi:hypothetical protein [Methyloglobulus morosus]|uniref:hypothetical protein n=1 Tax=Methyloglobulus morosus TaxID=1410681 RepID=UPI001F3AE8D6|nr:hypothetical protein [Methyloglobulus morosus]